MANKHTTSNIWSFNHRVHVGHLSDSDSENDSEVEATVPDSGDARLAQAMDLSVRQETVEYRPNPWSIAKINAASRTSVPKPTVPDIRTLVNAPPSPKHQPKRIVEAFKKQAERGERQQGQSIVLRTVKQKKGGVVQAPIVHPGTTIVPQNTTQPTEMPLKPKSAHISASYGQCIPPKPPALLRNDERTFGLSYNSRRPLVQSSPMRVLSQIGRRNGVIHSSPGPRPVPRPVQNLRKPPASAPVSSNTGPVKSGPLRATGGPSSATLPGWLSAALDEGTKPPPQAVRPDVTPASSNDVPDCTYISTPEQKRKRPSSPPPIPPSKKRRPVANPEGPSAYAFGVDLDPDATWSTLPSRGGRKKSVSTNYVDRSRSRGMKQSGCFRLPIPGLMEKMEKQEPKPKPRVITYLPPPMPIGKPAEREPTNIREASKRKRTVSPERDADQGVVEMRVMDSDEVTLVNDDDAETVVSYNVDGVSAAYHETRVYMKEVSALV